MAKLRAIIDTNILFEGLTQRESTSGFVLKAWEQAWFRACLSNALLFEYMDVLERKLSAHRYKRVKPALDLLVSQSEYVDIRFNWRPRASDPNDDFLVDAVMNASAILVSRNLKDFRIAQAELGFVMMSPEQFLQSLIQQRQKEQN